MLELAPGNIFISLHGLTKIDNWKMAASDHAIRRQIGDVLGLNESGKITLLNIGPRVIDTRAISLHGHTGYSALSRGDRCTLFRNAEICLCLSCFCKDTSDQHHAQSRA